MEPSPPPTMSAPDVPPPSPGSILPPLSSTVLLAMGAIGGLVLASIFGYILFVARLRLDEQLWWTGFASIIFALGFFVLFAATHDRKIARPLAGGFFVISAGSFYGSIFAGGSSDLAKLLYTILLSILVMIVLGAIFVMARDAERDAIRKAQRRHIP
ncbi:MAG: hypothetical protein E6K19_04675 [Methanobacteriota archaeon]|nr:MAG: hypothetical protein E6K19_04675 [Euryarchaeota archaeon]